MGGTGEGQGVGQADEPARRARRGDDERRHARPAVDDVLAAPERGHLEREVVATGAEPIVELHGEQQLLARLEPAGAAFILIDSPPRVPVADSLALSQFCDGAVVLALVGETPKNHLKETLERLKQVNTHIIGVVLNGVPTKGRYSRYYGSYSYGSYNYKNSGVPLNGNAGSSQLNGDAAVTNVFYAVGRTSAGDAVITLSQTQTQPAFLP